VADIPISSKAVPPEKINLQGNTQPVSRKKSVKPAPGSGRTTIFISYSVFFVLLLKS
jgi:hypothetical protein